MGKLFVSNKNESARMFKSDYLEFFSKVHFTTPLYFFLPAIGYFVYLGLAEREYSIGLFFGLVLAGFVLWTISEYLLHRFLFHYHPKSELGKRFFFIIHGVHHDYPNDAKRLVLPPALSLPLATMFYFIFKYTIGDYYLPPFFAAFLLGYLVYDLGHYAMHHFKLKGKFWGAIKDHHMRHHYVDPENGFGVSSPLWDVIFRSGYEDSTEVKEPSRD
ncbi:MAG: sterol desaturase family protein [Cyclobacteriaceae bacterium]